MRAPALFALVLSIAACSPSVRSAWYVPAPAERAATDASALRIYEHTRPACAFEEIGRVTGWARLPTHSPDEIVAAMRRRAAEMGGDAIIGFSERVEAGGTVVAPITELVAVASTSSSIAYVGTVIRFTDPDCSGAG